MCKSEAHNLLIEKVNKIALSGNSNNIIKSIDCRQTYAYETSEETIRKNEDIKCNNMIKQ